MKAHRLSRFGMVSAVLACLATGARGQSVQGRPSAEDDSMLYTVTGTDTLRGICERFLGSGAAIPELMGYNRIADPNAIGEGSVLVIPLGVRTHAVAVLEEAERQLEKAADAAAEVYANDEFVNARGLVADARAARQAGDYSRTVSLSKRGRVLADLSRKLADERAPIQQEATITFVHGRVERSPDGGTNWVGAVSNDVISVGGQVRTGSDSRAEVRLADGSVVQIQQESRFQLVDFLIDRRTGVRSSRLKVYSGGILGTVEPKKVRQSEFQIDTGAASVAIRGTELRVSAENQDTRLSVLQATTNTAFVAAGRSIEVPEKFGSISRNGRAPKPPVELLPAPGGYLPPAILHRTAVQTPSFSWDPVADARTAGYRLEIARDTGFHQIVQDLRTPVNRARASVLSEGRYFWRVLTFDGDGIEGAFGERRGLEIDKNYAVEILPTGRLARQGGVWVARPEIGYLPRAARTDTSVVRVWHSLDGTNWSLVDGVIELPDDGDYTIHARGECLEEELGPIETLRVRVDGTPPEVTATPGAVTEVEGLGPTVFVSLAATDPAGVDRIEYGFDGKGFVEYAEPVAFSARGRGRLYYRAFDGLGNGSKVERLELPGEGVPQ